MLPTYVKVAGGLNCLVLGAMGLRGIFSPGKAIPLFSNGPTSKHMWAGLEPSELSDGQVAYSNLMGFACLGLVLSKLATLFSGKEGTFLRRNLLLVFGAVDIALSASILRFERGFRVAGGTLKGISFIHLVEGSAFLYDAIFRPRPVKPSSKVSKGQ